MKQFLIISILVSSLVCYTSAQNPAEMPKDWKSLAGCGVSIYVPADVAFVEDQSVDTCERYYQGKNTSVQISATEWNVGQGAYSNWPDHCVTRLLINDKKAEIVTSFIPVSSDANKGRDFSAMLLVPDFFPDGRDLEIRTWSTSEKDRMKALAVLQSARLESSK